MKTKSISREELVCNDKVISNIFLVYVLLVIVQDLFLQLPLGTIARSPYIFISPLIFVLISFFSAKLYLIKPVKYYLVYYIYSIIVTAIAVLYLYMMYGVTTIWGENLIVKCIKNSMYNLIIIITLYNYFFIFRYSSLKLIERILKYLVLVQIVIGCIQIFMPNAFDILKTPQLKVTARLTLLSTEPSHTFPQFLLSLLCYGCIRYYNNLKFKALDLFVFVTGFLLLLMIQSRGGVVIMFICFLFILFFSRQTLKNRLFMMSVSIIFIVPSYWVIMNIIVPQLAADLEQFSSVSTRSITIFTALKSLLVYPFGQGYGTYLFTFPLLLDATINNVITWSPVPLSTLELDLMLDTGRSLTVKSGLLNEILYSGWAIIIFYIFFFSNAYRNLRHIRERRVVQNFFQYILIFIIINYLLVSSIETAYITFLPFALLERFSRETTVSHNLNIG